MNSLAIYLTPTRAIDADHTEIISLARDLTQNINKQEEILQKLFYFVRDECRYNMYSPFDDKDNRASEILKKGHGNCLQKALLLSALGRSLQIPVRLAMAAIRNYKAPPDFVEEFGTNVFFPHTYNQFYIHKRWVTAAATFDKYSCNKIQVPTVEFDGVHDAILPAYDNKGDAFIEYVDHYGFHADLPSDWIYENMAEFYGENFKEIWHRKVPSSNP